MGVNPLGVGTVVTPDDTVVVTVTTDSVRVVVRVEVDVVVGMGDLEMEP